jgi:hypothetical protein
MTVTSQRDVVFTPFMLRIRDVLDGVDSTVPLRIRPSALRPIAEATDEWFYLRARSEQVLAEANAMLSGRVAPVDLEDEYGTDQLAFVLRWGGRSARICMGQIRRQGWVEFQRRYVDDVQPVEPEDQEMLEDLVVELLTEAAPPGSASPGTGKQR